MLATPEYLVRRRLDTLGQVDPDCAPSAQDRAAGRRIAANRLNPHRACDTSDIIYVFSLNGADVEGEVEFVHALLLREDRQGTDQTRP